MAKYNRLTMDRPSGSELPLFLRRRLDDQQGSGSIQQDHESSGLSPSANVQAVTKQDAYGQPSSSATSQVKNRIFTAEELEERIWKTTIAMVEVQKQIHKGEETYYEETYSHGNLFRGWDAFVDAKDVGVGAKDVGAGAGRRVPADTRWFSGSCRSISRNARPTPLIRSVSSAGSRPPSTTNFSTNVTTSVPTSSMRSESNTPTLTNTQVDANSASGRTIPSTGIKATEAQSGTQLNASTMKGETSNTELGIKTNLSETPIDSEKQAEKTSYHADAPKEPGGTSDVIMKTEELDQSNSPSTNSTPDTTEESESSTKNYSNVVDVPIPKKKDSKLTPGKTDNEAPAIGSSIVRKEGVSKKGAPMEALKKQDDDTNVQKEGSANNERETTTQQEPPKQEDPFKRRITRKRKSMSESDK